jgi:hypothetical protein
LAASLSACRGYGATIVNWHLDQNSVAGTFQVSAKLSGDVSGGIFAYRIRLQARPGTTILSLDNKTPNALSAQNGSLSGPVGFTDLRSDDLPQSTLIQGAQDLIPPTPFILYNYGISAGSFATVQNGPATPVGSSEGDNWFAKPIIAIGTFTPGGAVQLNLLGAGVTVFTQVGSLDYRGATSVVVPEPIAVGTAVIGAFSIIGIRRRLTAC